MWGFGETVTTGRGGPQGADNFLQESCTSGTSFWIEDLVTFGVNVEEGRVHTHQVSETDHKKAMVIDSRQDMGDSQVRSSAGSCRNSVRDDLHRDTKGDCGTVGGIVEGEKSYECGGHRKDVWWIQEGAEKQLKVTSAEILR